MRIDIKGPITAKLTDQIKALIQNQAAERGANFFCLWIESAGGDATDSVNLANYLASLDPSEQRTVAYIPNHARSDAAYIALAADHIVMHPTALLGGAGDSSPSDNEIKLTEASLREIARRKGRSPAISAAIVNPEVAVYRYIALARWAGRILHAGRPGAEPDAAGWQHGAQIGQNGQTLSMNGEEAEQYGVARHLVRDFNEFKSFYGLEDDPALVEPNWAHTLIEALNSPGVSLLLLFLGGAALYAELQSPGIGVGGLIAALCFVLYFWVAYLGGTATWLEVLLFLSGMVCLLMEIFVLPGMGLFGLAGGLLVIISLVLASQTFVLPRNAYQIEQLRNSLLLLTGAAAGVVVAAVLSNRYLPHAPMFNRMMLSPPTDEEMTVINRREALISWSILSGRAVPPHATAPQRQGSVRGRDRRRHCRW